MERVISVGLHASFPHGTISTYSDGKYLGTKMFLEVARDSSNKAEPLPGGNYLCYQEPREKHSDPTAIFPGELFGRKRCGCDCVKYVAEYIQVR